MSFKNFSTSQDAHPSDKPDAKAKDAPKTEKQAAEAAPAPAAPASKP
jgi:hypothetical protein